VSLGEIHQPALKQNYVNAVYLLNKISGGQTFSKTSSVLSLHMNAAEWLCTRHTLLVAELSAQVLRFDPKAVLVGFITGTLGPDSLVSEYLVSPYQYVSTSNPHSLLSTDSVVKNKRSTMCLHRVCVCVCVQ